MRYKLLCLSLLLTLILSGCTTQPPTPSAGLMVANSEKSQWNVDNHLLEQGGGNSHRVLSTQRQGETMLELVAGSQGQVEYSIEGQADVTALAQLRLQFLSTQGQGIVKWSALDQQGNVIGQVGSIFTGKVPLGNGQSQWQDLRYKTNYQGDWVESNDYFTQLFASLPQESMARAARYRLSVEVGQGQHVLITQFGIGTDQSKAIHIIPSTLTYTAIQGDVLSIEADVQNVSSQEMKHVVVKLIEPYGYGLLTTSAIAQTIEQLAPGQKQHVSWQVQAKRASAVNVNQPWSLKFSVNEQEMPEQVQVAVVDRRPGKIFYVMTEDLEPIDGAGYPTAWGNCDSWLEPEEFLGQMVHKAEALDRIAEKHGAKWTHYIAWPAVKAAEWAESQSQTGNWAKAINAIKDSVTRESERGHEYGVHLHSDYDPYLPGNVLSYNSAVDGLWANHLKHGWAHSVMTEGDFSDYASRAGMLYDYQRIIDQLASTAPQGQLLTARVGSFDFGNGKADETMSTNVYRKVGLWGSSDADGNTGDALTSGEYGREIYFAAPDDINTPANTLKQVGVVEFRPTPRESIAYDTQSAMTMNSKTDQGMQYFTAAGASIKPGIHAIIGFTHAMFIMGNGDWQSTEGGQFQVIDDHLAYLQKKYAQQGVLTFATASELVEAYLDYYTPQLLALYRKKISDENGIAEYAIRILGSDIQVDENHTHIVNIKYPLYLRDSAYRINILKNGQIIYKTWGLPTPFNDIQFMVDDKQAVYTLKIYHNELVYKVMSQIHALQGKIVKIVKKISWLP